MEKILHHFTIKYGFYEQECTLTKHAHKPNEYQVMLAGKPVYLTREHSPDGIYYWLIDGISSGVSEALGAAIEEAEKHGKGEN